MPSLFSIVCEEILEAMLLSSCASGWSVSAHAVLPVVFADVLISSCMVCPSTGLCIALLVGTGSSSWGGSSLLLTSALAMASDDKAPCGRC